MNIFAVTSFENKVNYNKTKNTPSFGMIYSKNTIKSLKYIVPELIRKEGMESARLAVANLKKLGQRKDNILINLVPDGHYCSIEPGVNWVKNKQFEGFVHCVNTPRCIEFASCSKTPFLDFTKSLTSKKFVDAAHSRINEYANFIKNETFKEKIVRKSKETKELFFDAVDWMNEQLSVVDGCVLPNGKETKSSLMGWENLKTFCKKTFAKKERFISNEVAFLRKEIDTLPTKI